VESEVAALGTVSWDRSRDVFVREGGVGKGCLCDL
jgi:hypothetical protein